MIYLSQLMLNVQSPQVQRELRSPYEMHRTLSRAFPDDATAYAEARCLFRVEENGKTPVVLVQSRIAPDWDNVTQHAPRYLVNVPQTKMTEVVLTVGQRLAFRLHANPTVKRDGKRLPLRQEQEQMTWLQRKGTLHGFQILQARVRQDIRTQARTADGHTAYHEGVTFDGILQVTDAVALQTALECGIGSAKGFGFGLLSLARA